MRIRGKTKSKLGQYLHRMEADGRGTTAKAGYIRHQLNGKKDRKKG